MNPEAAAPIVSTTVSRRDWFLRDSLWSDTTWILTATSVLEEEHPVHFSWDYGLPSGKRLTDPSYATLLESARRVIAIVRTRSITTSLPQRASTVRIYFNQLRTLVRWMDSGGFRRFDQLDATALSSFKLAIAARTQHEGKRVLPTTLERHLRVFNYLHRHGALIGDGLTFDPWPGQGTCAVADVHRHQRRAVAYTPGAIAVPLVQGAIDFLASCAVDILRARETYAVAITQARGRGVRKKARLRAARKALRARPISTPLGEQVCRTVSDFYQLLDMLYAACFVVIAYLVGARVSEILHLRSGCLQPFGGAHESTAMLTGAIFKLESGYHGRPHQWVAPEPAV